MKLVLKPLRRGSHEGEGRLSLEALYAFKLPPATLLDLPVGATLQPASARSDRLQNPRASELLIPCGTRLAVVLRSDVWLVEWPRERPPAFSLHEELRAARGSR